MSALETIVDVPEFRILEGSIIELVPQILRGTDKKGEVVDVPREIMTPKQMLYGRVHRNLLRNNYIDTACAVIGDPDLTGEVIVGLYSDPLVEKLIRSLNPKSKLRDGSLPVDRDVYQEIRRDALVISREAAENLRDNPYNEQRLRKRVWDHVAEGDAGLVRDHLSLVQKRSGESMENRMGLWVSSNPGLRLLCAWSVGDDGGGAGGGSLLDGDYGGRLVGVAPEAPRVFGPCATYRDAPQQVPKQEPRRSQHVPKQEPERTVWDSVKNMFRGSSR